MKYILRLSALAAVMFMMLPGRAMAADLGGIGEFGFNPYVGLGMGTYDLKFSEPGFNQSNNVFGGMVRVGADFNDYLGVELRYGATDKGTTNYPTGTVRLSADYLFSYLLKLQVPVTQEFHVYGLVGGTHGKVKVRASTPTILSNTSYGKIGKGLSFGAGIDYQVDDFMSIGIEGIRYWNRVKFNSVGSPDNKMTIDGYTATLKIQM